MLEKLLGKSSWLKIAKRYAGQCIVFSLTLILIVGGYKSPEAVDSEHRQQTTKLLPIGVPTKLT